MNTLRILLLTLCFISNTTFAQWHDYSFKVMGTISHVQLWLDTSHSANANELFQLVEDEMNRIDRLMSPYKPNSEVSKINRLAANTPLIISIELFDLLVTAQDISKLSAGAFDLTYASVGYKYNYRDQQKPSSKEIQALLPKINYHSISLSPKHSSISLRSDKIKIDLGGIAKGHAIKRCLDILKQHGVLHALVSAGGDTALLGDRKGRPWLVGIKHPRADEKTVVHIPLENEAISTSGDYERFFVKDGVRYHHIINPQTGESANEVVSVSIVGKDATYVDALSTTVFVKGLTKGLEFIEQLPDYEAIVIDKNYQLYFSSGLRQ